MSSFVPFVSIPLQHPVKHGGMTIAMLNIRYPRPVDMPKLRGLGKATNPARILDAIAALSGLPREVVELLSLEDISTMNRRIEGLTSGEGAA